MEIARDEVRVMTVHGAKGLEAPIVILADTMTPPAGPLAARAAAAAGRRCCARHARAPGLGRAEDDDVGPVRERARAARREQPKTNTGGCSMWR